MARVTDRKQRRQAVKQRYADKVRGTSERPRLAVYRSLRHVSAQLIDDIEGRTIVAASTLEKAVSGGLKYSGNREAAAAVGKLIAQRGQEHGIEAVVFDRGGFPYHGVVRSLAEAAREAGLKF